MIDPRMDGTNPPSPEADATRANLEEKINLENGVKRAGNWFFFIAAATAINTFSHVFLQGDWYLFIGLGISKFIDVIAIFAVKETPDLAGLWKGLATVINLIAVSICVLFGVFARKQKSWAFIVGMVVVALDSLLFVLAQDWLAFGFHVIAVLSIRGGYNSLKQLNSINAGTLSGPSAEPLSDGVSPSAIAPNKIETNVGHLNLVQIHISRNNQQMGPYTYEEVQSHLAQGSLLPTDYAWHEGLKNWTQLSEIPPQKANKSNLVLLAYITAVSMLLGSVAWVLQGSKGEELLTALAISLVMSFMATGVIIVRRKFNSIGMQLLAVFIFTALSIGLTVLFSSLELTKNSDYLKIFGITNIGGILCLMTLVIYWVLEKIRTKFQ